LNLDVAFHMCTYVPKLKTVWAIGRLYVE
jgi:hypothetical protein